MLRLLIFFLAGYLIYRVLKFILFSFSGENKSKREKPTFQEENKSKIIDVDFEDIDKREEK